MASGGSIVVRILGDDSQLQEALKRAQTGVERFSAGMRIGINSAVKYGAALAALGAGAVTALVVNQMKAIDSTAKFSDQIGIATEDLMRLQFAARDAAGVTDQTFNMAMRRMTRRIAEAAQGSGPAAQALKDLGLNAQQLKDAGPAEAFRRISDAMANTTSHADRLRIAFKLFDTDGGALVPLMMQGSQALDEYAKKADALGLAFNRVDAAKVEAASDAMARIGDVIDGVRNRLTIELAFRYPTIGMPDKVAIEDSVRLAIVPIPHHRNA